MICIEDYFMPANKGQLKSAMSLAALGTIMRLTLFEAGFAFYVVAPSQLKKFATGKGTGQKSIVVREVFKRWGVEAKDDNQADACTLAHIAEALITEDPERVKFQAEVVKKVTEERPHYNVED
jgi:crossover junction endodeoxyribonuclease RuvC